MAQSHKSSGHANKSHHKARFFGGAAKTWALIAVIRSEVGASNPSLLSAGFFGETLNLWIP